MDQKNKIVARLQERFAGFSLSGSGVVEDLDRDLVATRQEKAGAAAAQPAGEMTAEKAARVRLAARYAHLEPMIRGQIEALIVIEQNFPIRGFLTDDQRRAGIIIDDSVREYHWPEFCRYSKLFFGPAHEAICTVFQKELQAVARHYGKNQPVKKETTPYAVN